MGIDNVRIVMVSPLYGGNVGSIARSMANFGFRNLRMINPCVLDDDCFKRARHASEIVHSAPIFDTFPEAVADIDLLIGTSGVPHVNVKTYTRNPLSAEEMAAQAGKTTKAIERLLARAREQFRRCYGE